MPHTKSAAKRMITDARKHRRNQGVKSELKTLTKKLYKLLTDKPAQARDFARGLVRRLDKAASRGIIPKKKASRRKSRLARLLTKYKISLS